MSLSKTRAKKKEQVLEAATAAQGVDQSIDVDAAARSGGDVATLGAGSQEQDAPSAASIGGRSTGPVEIGSGDQGQDVGEDVGGDMGGGGFFGWLGGLFGWGSSSADVRSTASESGPRLTRSPSR